eukprot:06749_3
MSLCLGDFYGHNSLFFFVLFVIQPRFHDSRMRCFYSGMNLTCFSMMHSPPLTGLKVHLVPSEQTTMMVFFSGPKTHSEQVFGTESWARLRSDIRFFGRIPFKKERFPLSLLSPPSFGEDCALSSGFDPSSDSKEKMWIVPLSLVTAMYSAALLKLRP